MIQVLHHVRRVHLFVQMLNVLTFALLQRHRHWSWEAPKWICVE